MTKKLQGRGGQSKPVILRGKDMTSLFHGLTNRLLWATQEELAYYSSIDTMFADVMALSSSSEYELNIGKELWLTPSRWSTLIRQYINPELLFKFLEEVKRISTYNRGIVALDTNTVNPTIVESNARANRRKQGACIRMITYRAFPKPTISMYSRTSYVAYIGGLDLMLAHKIAEMACDMIGEGLELKDMAFRWHLEVAQWHGFKCMAYIFANNMDGLMRAKRWPEGKRIWVSGIGEFNIDSLDHYPSWKIIRNWWQRLNKQDLEGKLYSDMKYGAEIRIRRRYHSNVLGSDEFTDKDFGHQDPLDVPMSMVNLDAMLYKTPESRAIIRRRKKAKAEQLVKELFSDEEVLRHAVGKFPESVFQGAEMSIEEIVGEIMEGTE